MRVPVYALLLGLMVSAPTVRADGDGGGDATAYDIEIHKNDQLLLLKRGEAIAKRYHVALGSGGRGDKRESGDKRTPLGVYHVTEMVDNSPFHLFMRLDYPNVKDAYFGLKNKLISRVDFDRIVSARKAGTLPPQNTRLGGAIGIHGLPADDSDTLIIHRHANWTKGCIALTNPEVNELRNLVAVGTKVTIKE
ncbi:MAG: L,D-transpeptidase family protein [Gammaproteobacteria bacterium]|nr:L,D-transpeptidase family protein [Gammaproteobacteria bacterium]